LDIVAGGNGTGYRREHGFDPSTGMQDSLFVPSWRLGNQQYHRTSTCRFIDGVFVADGNQGAVSLDSSGHTFDGFPKTDRKSWGSIWARAAGVGPDARALGADYWVYAADFPPDLMPKNRGLLALGGNSGITFSLAAIGKNHRGRPFDRFRAAAANCGNQACDMWVFVDGRLKWKSLQMAAGSRVQPVEIEVGPTDQFLTLATTTKGDKAVHSGAAFGDPVLELSTTEPETSAAISTFAVAPSTSTIYSEDFEAFSAGPLYGQGGWTAGVQPGVINVGTGGRLGNAQILAVRAGRDIPDAVHSLGSRARVDSSQVTTLQWDGEYGGSTSSFGFNSAPTNPDEDFYACWCSMRSGWLFDPLHVTGAVDDRVHVAGGTSGAVRLKLVIDGPARTLAGYYDFGGGWTQAGRCTITLAQIEAIANLRLCEDYRDGSGGDGIGIDNITLSSSAVSKPSRVRQEAQ
jgi:hypothetical protein